jgi:hypothetical protein
MAVCRPRGRIKEAVSVFVDKDQAVWRHLHESLMDEEESIDWCVVCHQLLNRYQDGRCIFCRNTAVCKSCVQNPDRGIYAERRVVSSPHGTLAEGTFLLLESDAICLQCGLYSSNSQIVQKYETFHQSCAANEALFGRNQDFGLKLLAFVGWKMCLRVLRSSSVIKECLSRYLTFAEDARLYVLVGFELSRVIGRRKRTTFM